MNAVIRRSMATLFALAAVVAAPAAFAEGEACFNDDDCPGGGAVCGGDVCNWSKSAATPVGENIFYCNPAGSQPKAADGWCTDDSDCKCKGEGATCKQTYCTFTKPGDAPAGSGGSGAGGASSTAGTTSAAGTTSTAGAPSTAGSGSTSKPAEESSSCSVASPASTGGGIALALGMLGLGAAFARRRR